MAYTAAQLFSTMHQRFKPEAAGNLEAVVVYEFGDGRMWTVRISNSVLKVDAGDAAQGRENVRIIFKTEDVMLDIIRGKADPLMAILNGDSQVVGDWRLLLKVKSLFEVPKGLMKRRHTYGCKRQGGCISENQGDRHGGSGCGCR